MGEAIGRGGSLRFLRPHQPFARLFREDSCDTPHSRNDDVVEQLACDGIVRAPAPLPCRATELDYLTRALELEPPGML